MITACWWQDGVRRADSIRIGAVLEKWEDGGRQAVIGAAGGLPASELAQMKYGLIQNWRGKKLSFNIYMRNKNVPKRIKSLQL